MPPNTKTNAQRGRPMVTITLSPEGLAELDFRREGSSRGRFLEWLLRETTPDARRWKEHDGASVKRRKVKKSPV